VRSPGCTADDAAEVIGAIAGLDPNEASTGPRFAELAAAFDDLVGKVWSWRSAWLDDTARPTRREEVRPDRLPSDR